MDKTAIPGLLAGLRWLGHAGFLLRGRQSVYIDPRGTPAGLPPADIILLTHGHPGHCSPEDIARLARPQTVVVGPADCVCRFSLNQLELRPGQTKSVLGLEVTGVAACGPGHPRERGWLGFVVAWEGARVFHAGDTEPLPEHAGLRADLALVPVGEGTLEPSVAVGLARAVGAAAAWPMHYRDAEKARAETFAAQARAEGLAGGLP